MTHVIQRQLKFDADREWIIGMVLEGDDRNLFEITNTLFSTESDVVTIENIVIFTVVAVRTTDPKMYWILENFVLAIHIVISYVNLFLILI
jgi:hypothetical protein